MTHKLICLVGMCGSGKSEVANYLQDKKDLGYVRFGQVVLDKIKEMGEKTSEALERKIREEIRQEHGMAAMAILNLPKFDKLLETGDVIGDGLYSWEEYLVLKEKYGDNLIVIAVYAPPAMRYDRLEGRADRHAGDTAIKYRSFSKSESASRDRAEIEKLNKGGPIAMADYTVSNITSVADLHQQLDRIIREIF